MIHSIWYSSNVNAHLIFSMLSKVEGEIFSSIEEEENNKEAKSDNDLDGLNKARSM
jgi:hypothetical protein